MYKLSRTYKKNDALGRRLFWIDEHHINKQHFEAEEKSRRTHYHEKSGKSRKTPIIKPLILSTGPITNDEWIIGGVSGFEIFGLEWVTEFENRCPRDVIRRRAINGIVIGSVCETRRDGEGWDCYNLVERGEGCMTHSTRCIKKGGQSRHAKVHRLRSERATLPP